MNGTQITGSSHFNDTLPLEPVQAESPPYATANLMRPEEVVADLRLTDREKRELLASWASDIHAVPDAPELRQLDNGAVVPISDILLALKSLDADKLSKHTRWRPYRRSSGLRVRLPNRLKSALRRSWSDDDDDDPPPCPAMIFRPPGGPLPTEMAVEPGLAA